jgi:hypothetical protein
MAQGALSQKFTRPSDRSTTPLPLISIGWRASRGPNDANLILVGWPGRSLQDREPTLAATHPVHPKELVHPDETAAGIGSFFAGQKLSTSNTREPIGFSSQVPLNLRANVLVRIPADNLPVEENIPRSSAREYVAGTLRGGRVEVLAIPGEGRSARGNRGQEHSKGGDCNF